MSIINQVSPSPEGKFITKSRKSFFKTTLLTTALSIFALVQLYPLIWMVLFSLKSNSDIYSGNSMGLPKEYIFDNYKVALVGGKVGVYFLNSVFVTVVTIAVTSLFALMAAYVIERFTWKLSKQTLNFFLLGLMIPLQAALLPIMLILKQMHLINTYFALILPYVAFSLPMAILIFTSFLQSIPKEMEEAAVIDGCSVFQCFTLVIIPLVKPAIATVSIFIYLQSWNELMFAMTYITKQAYRTIPVGLQAMIGQYNTNWGPIGAGLVVATVPTIILYLLMSKQVQKSLMTGAVKG